MKKLVIIGVVAAACVSTGCTTTIKPVPARPMIRIDGWDAIKHNNQGVGYYYCPYASMDETHRRLRDEGRK